MKPLHSYNNTPEAENNPETITEKDEADIASDKQSKK